MNLTKVNGCYAKELKNNLHNIKAIFSDGTKSYNYMKQYVLKVIEPAYINATAKKRFIEYLEGCAGKYEIYNLCYNTVRKAMNYQKYNY